MDDESDNFEKGYVDGWQSLKPGTNPPGIPAYALPAGKTPYEHGFALGRLKALERLQ